METPEPPKRLQELATKIMLGLDRKQQFRLVAFIVRNGKILSIGVNNPFKSHPKIHRMNPKKNTHAELRCILNASYEKMKGATIYVFRLLNKKLQYAMAKPCECCEIFIREAGIKRVVFTTRNGGFEMMKV